MLTQDLGIATAYGYAKSKGYTGTEEEFAELMASYADVAESAEASAESASSSASDSEAYAVGKRGGTDVGSEDVAYHNNAKYYADQADSSASSASSDANSASSSKSDAEAYAVGKRNGTDVESSDVAYHNNAKYYSEQASDSASTATSAKDIAVSSKDTAVSKAGEASASATSANAAKLVSEGYAVGKQNGTDVESESPYYENNAKYYAEQAEETLHEYARIDGYYQEMTVGDAEQLVATTFTEDDAPYNFRTAGGAIDIGDRKQVEGIVGGTVAWNQLHIERSAPYTARGVTISAANNGKVTVTGTRDSNGWLGIADAANYIANHKILVIASNLTVESGNTGGAYLALLRQYTQVTALNTTKNYAMFTYASDTTISFSVGGSIDDTYNYSFIPQMFDLTQMFGSAIADYIYSLETANAGAGVAWFKKLFPKPYYAYNAGELMSVKALRHITRGFNAWDEEWELGAISSTTGQPYSNNSAIRSKNYCRCLPNTTYYAGTNGSYAAVYQYDANQTFIGYIGANGDAFTTYANAYYFKLAFSSAYGTTYKNDICINLSWDGERDGEYEEYAEHVYELDPDLELRGIPKLTAGNDLYYDGDVYEPDGTVTRKYGIVDLGSLTWAYNDSIPWFYSWTNASDRKATNSSDLANVKTAKYVTYKRDVLIANDVTGICIDSSGNVVVRDANYTDATDFKTAMNGVYLVYELAEPTEESADPYNGIQIVDDFGTEEFVDAGVAASTPTRDVAIPVGHNSLYQPNLRAKLEMVPEAPEDEGYYVVYHHDGINEYVPLIIPQELPNLPSEDGTYTLKATVSGGTPTYTWEAEE